MQTFKGTFNYQGEVTTLHTKAPNRSAAYSILTRVMALRLGLRPSAVRRYFRDGGRDRFEIIEEGGKKWLISVDSALRSFNSL